MANEIEQPPHPHEIQYNNNGKNLHETPQFQQHQMALLEHNRPQQQVIYKEIEEQEQDLEDVNEEKDERIMAKE